MVLCHGPLTLTIKINGFYTCPFNSFIFFRLLHSLHDNHYYEYHAKKNILLIIR